MNRTSNIAGCGEMGVLVNAHEWASTPLGPVETWSTSLKAAVGTVLCCQLPMYLAWGNDLIQIYNDAYLPILGPRHPAALGRSARETWPEIWPTIGPMWQDVLRGKPVGFNDFKLTIERFGYPEDRFFNFSYSPVHDDDGMPAGVLVTFVDTTDRVQAEQRARFELELADGLRGLADPDAITEWTCGVLGRHLDARRVGYALVQGADINVHLRGWHDGSVETIVGRSVPLDAFGPALVDELRQGATVRIDDVACDARTSAHTAVFDRLKAPAMLMVPLVRDSQLIAVVVVGAREARHWTDHEAMLVEDAAERTRSAVERAIAEHEQARADAFYRFILDRAFAAIVVHDAQGSIVFANPMASSFLGLAVDDLRGRALTDPSWHFVREDGTRMPLDEFPVAIVSRTGKPVTGCTFGIAPGPDAEPAWVLVNAFPQFDAQGRLRHTVVSFVDITRHKASEAKLLAADRRKDEFLAMLAHELRNPLAPIGTAAQILKRAGGDAERTRHAGEVIERQVGHLTSLVDDLLDVSRVTRGLVAIERAPVDVRTVVSAALEQAQPLFRARGHAVHTSVSAGHSIVDGDFNRLVQVVVNLLANAAKYTPQNGRIDVEVRLDGEQVAVCVADNGVGIDADLLPGVFDLFTQAERTPDRAQGGLGIGLALVRSLVTLHGGTVQADSEGAGRGSRFTIRLPRSKANEVDGQALVRDPSTTRARRVLVVDDNADAAETLAELLRMLGNDVVTAPTGSAALATAPQSDWDACILDIGLPDMTGLELAERLKRLPACRGATFVALTGYGQGHDRTRSLAAGFDHHMVKPPDIAALVDLIEHS